MLLRRFRHPLLKQLFQPKLWHLTIITILSSVRQATIAPTPQPVTRTIRPRVVSTQPAIRFLPQTPRSANKPTLYNYLSLKGFFSKPDEFSVNDGGTAYDIKSREGFALLASAGRRFPLANGGVNARLELEGAHRRSRPETRSNAGGSTAITTGKTTSNSLMINLLAEIAAGSIIKPYFGAGIGGARVDHSSYVAGGAQILDDRDFTVAYQGVVGAAFNMGNNIEFVLEGRHFRAADVERTVTSGTQSEDDFVTTEIGAGFNFNF